MGTNDDKAKTDSTTSSGKWQDTLYIWDGIVTVNDKAAAANDEKTEISVSWEGTWVPVDDCPDATLAAAPKRNAFAEYVDSDFLFSVSGKATMMKGDEDGEDENQPEMLYIAQLVGGDGWDMDSDDDDKTKKKKYQDDEHDVLVKNLRWSGNMFDQTNNLIVSKGRNEFGPFVSVGWMRPGNRWTLARRYLTESDGDNSSTDQRVKWTVHELQEAVLKEAVEVVEGTGQKKLMIPPWHNTILHSEYQEPSATKDRGEKRKLEEGPGVEGEARNKEPKQ